MADLVQTAADVQVGSQTIRTRLVRYGEAVTQGMPLYKSGSDSKYYQSDASAEATAKCEAIALTPGSADDYGVIALPASEPDFALVDIGATLTVGEPYAVSATKGAIAPVGDLLSTEWVCIIGVAKTASLLDFQVITPSAAKA